MPNTITAIVYMYNHLQQFYICVSFDFRLFQFWFQHCKFLPNPCVRKTIFNATAASNEDGASCIKI